MTPDDLDAIEARANAATVGPWRSTWPDTSAAPNDPNDTVVESLAPGLSYVGRMVVGTLYHDGDHAVCSEANAAFIAAARTDVPALVAHARALHAAVRELAAAEAVYRSERTVIGADVRRIEKATEALFALVPEVRP